VSIFTDKRVVVTGGAGFVGSHLVELLLAQGAEVLVVDDMRRGHSYVHGSTIVRVDAGDPRALARPFQGAYAVFNLAAHVAGVIYNQHNHLEMYRENERVQVAPVLAAERAGVERFLQVSSVCVYSPAHNHPAREEDGQLGEPVAANNGYSWAKRMGERAALWSNIPHVVVVRPSNLYGPRDYFDDRAHVIPALIKKARAVPAGLPGAECAPIRVNGTGYEQREFLYVEDAARGMLAALEHGRHRVAYNLGTHGASCVRIRDLMAGIQIATDTRDVAVEYASDHDAGDPARWSDCTRMTDDTGWRWSTLLADGIQKTVDWHRGL
jgi:GDP-L-fucose synthase